MTVTPELAAALSTLVLALISAVVAYLEKLRRDLAENTKHTKDARAAAAAVQQATVDKLDYDRLRRMEAALLTLDECEGCRAKILALSERRRLRPRSLETDS